MADFRRECPQDLLLTYGRFCLGIDLAHIGWRGAAFHRWQDCNCRIYFL